MSLCGGTKVRLVGGPVRTDATKDRASVAVVYEKTGYAFTVGKVLDVPDALAKYLLGGNRPCGFGIFEEA